MKAWRLERLGGKLSLKGVPKPEPRLAEDRRATRIVFFRHFPFGEFF